MSRLRKYIRATVLLLSLCWMGIVYAQNSAAYFELRNKLDAHLLVAEGKSAHLEEVERRLSLIENTTRADRLDIRIAKIEATAESLRTMFFGMAVPVLLMGIESLRRLITEARKGAKN